MPFDGSSVLTLKLHMRHEWSYVRSEFVILEREEKLFSGKHSIKRPHLVSFILFLEKSESNCACWTLYALENASKEVFKTNNRRGQVIETCVQNRSSSVLHYSN